MAALSAEFFLARSSKRPILENRKTYNPDNLFTLFFFLSRFFFCVDSTVSTKSLGKFDLYLTFLFCSFFFFRKPTQLTSALLLDNKRNSWS